jgi:hypothetical protein
MCGTGQLRVFRQLRALLISAVLSHAVQGGQSLLHHHCHFLASRKCKNEAIKVAIPLGFGAISSLYFLIFTGGLLASSFRSIFLGIYTVE